MTASSSSLLAEFVQNVKQQPDGKLHVARLNQAYVDFQQAGDEFAAFSAAEHLRGLLEDVAQRFPPLVSQSSDLQSLWISSVR